MFAFSTTDARDLIRKIEEIPLEEVKKRLE